MLKEIKNLVKKSHPITFIKHFSWQEQLNQRDIQQQLAYIKKCKHINQADDDGNILLIRAIVHSPLLVQPLIKLGADVNLAIKHTGDTPLIIACQANRYYVPILLNNGANPNICNKQGRSPLMASTIFNHPDDMELLLKHGADVNHQNELKETALMHAIRHDTWDSLKILLKYKADRYLEDNLGETALSKFILSNKNISKIKKLITYNFNINHQNSEGMTPFMIVCKKQNHMIKDFIKYCPSFDINKQDNNGYTALMHLIDSVIKSYDTDNLLEILKLNPDLNLKTKKGLDILKFANTPTWMDKGGKLNEWFVILKSVQEQQKLNKESFSTFKNKPKLL